MNSPHRAKTIVFAAAALAWASVVSNAAPFDPSHVPTEAKWVLHVDMDAMRDGQLWKSVDDHLKQNENFQASVDQIAMFSGMRFPQDLHDFTVWGKKAGDDAGALTIHGNFDRNATMQALQMNPDFASQPFGTHEVFSWSDKGNTKFGAFFDDSTAIIAHAAEPVQQALAAMDDKSKGVKPGEGIATGAKEGQLAYIGVRDFPSVQHADAPPFLRKVDSGWIGVTEGTDGIHLNAEVSAKDEVTTKQIDAALNGLIAFVGLMNGSTANDPRLALANDAVKTCTLKLAGNHVDIEWPVNEKQAADAIDLFFAARQHSAD